MRGGGLRFSAICGLETAEGLNRPACLAGFWFVVMSSVNLPASSKARLTKQLLATSGDYQVQARHFVDANVMFVKFECSA